MGTFVENVNKLANNLTSELVSAVESIKENEENIYLIGSNISDITSVADTVVPNIAEILLADTNASSASASALSASASASSALNSATSAATSASQASALLDQFDDRYLGDKESDPSVDNDGNALLVGALYWNTIFNKMRIWDGSAWSDSSTLTASSIGALTNKTIDDMSNVVGADHVHYKVKATATISKGQLVKITGYNSGENAVEVQPVSSVNDVATGIAESAIANGSFSLVTNTGMIENVNTSSWTFGTILYSNGSGGLTSTKPTSGSYQACAIVLRSHAITGALLVEFTEPRPIASTTQSGFVQLNDTLTSTSTTQALTAAKGKALQDSIDIINSKDISITLTGDVTGSGTITNLGNVSLSTTIASNSVALGTDTTGNYVASLVAGTGISVGSAGESATPTVTNTAPNITTDISITHNSNAVVVNSSDGLDGTINAATQSLAGVMTAADKLKSDTLTTSSVTSVTFNADGTITIVTP